MAAARGGAKRMMAVDESAIALEVGAMCARENGLDETIEHVRHDARKALQEAHAKFDLVVVDPPRLAPSKARARGRSWRTRSSRARVPRDAAGRLARLLLVLGAVNLDALTRALAIGARHANVQAIVFERYFQGGDHPVSRGLPRGALPQGADRPHRDAVRRLGELAADEALAIRGVLFNLDDTLLTHGVLTREAYGALWDLREAGLRLVAVTGRPGGWGEVIARQWPIEAAVTENGAVLVRATGPASPAWSAAPRASVTRAGCVSRGWSRTRAATSPRRGSPTTSGRVAAT